MQLTDYFDDGYTRDGFIAAVPRLHGALRFSYRPVLVEQRGELRAAGAKLDSRGCTRHVAAFLTSQLVAWSLVDRRGQPVPVEADRLLRIHPELLIKLQNIVLGFVPSDVDPAWDEPAMQRELDESAAAALSGSTVGEVREERDEKN